MIPSCGSHSARSLFAFDDEPLFGVSIHLFMTKTWRRQDKDEDEYMEHFYEFSSWRGSFMTVDFRDVVTTALRNSTLNT